MMNTVIKRMISVMLCLILTVGLLPAQAMAAEEPDPGYLELNDGYLCVRVSKDNGGFLVDTVEGDKLSKSDDNKFLLYPDAAYDTSYTSFRVTRNGVVKDYIFGRNYSFLGLGENNLTVTKSAENVITATWSVDGLEFTQNIALLDTEAQQHGMAYITYSVKNTADAAVDKIEARVMLDTALGYQDYAVYMGAQADGTYTSIRTERTLAGTDYSNYFFAYDDEYAPSVTAYVLNATVGGTAIVPEKVTFAHWNNLASSVFDYEPEADHTQSLNFTNPFNEQYMTADSAVAMYYDLGTADAGAESTQAVALYYGVYSNANAQEGSVALNFAGTTDMMLTEEKNSYKDLNGDAQGNFTLTTKVQNTSGETIESLAVAIYTPEGMVSYDLNGNQNVGVSAADPFYVIVNNLKSGETRDITLNFLAEPTDVSDYRKINVRVFDLSDQMGTGQIVLLEEAVLGSRECYVLCPSVDGGVLSFVSTNPNTIYTSGTRHLYLAGKNFGLLRDTTQYRVVLRPTGGGSDVLVPASNVLINAEDNTADLVLDQAMNPGTWQVIIDWNDPGRLDTTGEALRFVVSNSPAYSNASYGVVAVWISGDGTDASPWHYNLELYADEAAYQREMGGVSLDQILLVFRGSFTTKYDEQGNLISAEAVSLKDGDAVSINDCLDVKDGRLTITVQRDENGNQTAINTDIDGMVYTTGAQTKVWEGVCAITSLEEGELIKFPVYKYDGSLSRYVEDQTANTNMLMLLWPGAASTAQTLAGMIMELRYAQFGVMATEPGGNPNKHVISFGAELNPNFLVPAANIPTQMDTDPIDVVQLKLAKSNYTADQLRDVQETYRADLERWKEVENGTLELRVTDILFGGGFIGFNTSATVGIPSYVEGMPSIEGTLHLKVINNEWALGVEGSADMMVFSMEAELALRSYNGIPVPDKVRFHVGGTMPGLPVDPFGVFWIRGAGAGIDKMYETFFVASSLPPLTLLLSGEFALFNVLATRADLGLSARGISAALSNITVAEIKILDYVGGKVYWYPRLDLSLGMNLSILGIINGSGTIVLQQIPDGAESELFWEGFATASITIPDYVLIIGGKELARADLGLDAERIFGVIDVLKVRAGVTYYWGGDVDFAFGKYDVPEPTIAAFRRAVPVYVDAESGKVLYMSAMTNARLLASSDSSIDIAQTQILTTLDGRSHTFTLDGSADEDALMYVTFPADSASEAQWLKNRFSVTCDGENYELVWMDNSKTADDPSNADANAMFHYDEDSKTVQITVSVTESRFFDKKITVNTPAISQISLYGLTRLADLESISVSGTTATISGSKLRQISDLTVYAADEDGNAWTLSTVDTQNLIGNAVQTTLRFPAALPSGDYTVKAVGTVKDETGTEISNPIVETNISYVNPNQPQKPTATAVPGGDYTIDVTPAASGDFDGYSLTVYQQTAQGQEVTIFQDQTFGKDLPVLTVGGQYTVPVADSMEGGAVLSYKNKTVGLEAGKNYVVGIRTYKTLADGTLLYSEETETAPVTMVAPVKSNVVLSISGAKMLSAGYSDVATAHVASSHVTVNVSGVDTVKNGSYRLNGEQAVSWNGGSIVLKDLPDGTYTITVQGENATSDSFGTTCQFTVDTTAPRMMLSSPQGGGFFEGETLTITGLSEAGAEITAFVDGTSVTASASDDGSFTMKVPMNVGMAYQDVVLTASDALGNETEPVTITMTNRLMGDPDATAVLLVNGKEAASVNCGGKEVQLELALKVGEQIVTLNSNSAAAALVDYQVVVYQGEANVTAEGILTASADVQGVVRATLEGYDAVVRLQNMDISNADVVLEIPEDGYVYDETQKCPPVISVTLNGIVLTEGVDYTVSYADNVAAGVGTVLIQAVEGSGYVGMTTKRFTIEKAIIDTLEPSVTPPAAGAEPQQTLNIPGLKTAQILWTANGQPLTGTFLHDTVYTASITLEADANHQFAQTVTAEGWTVTHNEDDTITITKEFPKTAEEDIPVEPVKTWLVTFVANNRVVATRVVNDGDTLTDIPEIPEKIGHTKTPPVWDVTDFTNIHQDMTVHAIYTIDTYTVTFLADGNVVKVVELEYRQSLSADQFPDIPEKKGYTDTPPIWDKTGITEIMADCTVTAIYTPNRYTVEAPAQTPGYTLTVEPTELTVEDTLVISVTPDEGYNGEKADIYIGGEKVDDEYITVHDGKITVTIPGEKLDDYRGEDGGALQITVTGIEKEKEDADGPSTADPHNPMLWTLAILLSLAAIVRLWWYNRKRNGYMK